MYFFGKVPPDLQDGQSEINPQQWWVGRSILHGGTIDGYFSFQPVPHD